MKEREHSPESGKKEQTITKYRYRKKVRNPLKNKRVFLALIGVLLGAAVLACGLWQIPAESVPAIASVDEEAARQAKLEHYLKEGNLGAAAGLLYEAIEQFPDQAGYYLQLASIYERGRNYDAAIEILERFCQVGSSEEVTAKLEDLRSDRERWIGWNQKAQAISEAIAAIGEVTLEKQEQIEGARSQYNKASDPVKALVTNYQALTEAESKLAELIAGEKEIARQIQELIDAIDGIGDVSLDKEKTVREIRAQYESSSDRVKAGVTNLDLLEKAEAGIKTLKELEAKRQEEERAEREAAERAAKEAQEAAQKQKQGEVFKLDVPYMSQEGVLPTGCELISSIMLLRYYGYSITPDNFIENYLTRGELTLGSDGELHGPHPSEAFIGNPYSSQGYGCYAPVIVKSLKKITGGEMEVKEVGGPSLAELTETYVKNGTPVLVWATIGMRAPTSGTRWILDNGQKFTWKRSEHCLVLVGYDNECYYFNDPYDSNGVVAYEKSLAESRYNAMGSQAVVMLK